MQKHAINTLKIRVATRLYSEIEKTGFKQKHEIYSSKFIETSNEGISYLLPEVFAVVVLVGVTDDMRLIVFDLDQDVLLVLKK